MSLPLPPLVAAVARALAAEWQGVVIAQAFTLNPNAVPFLGSPHSAWSGGMLRLSDSEVSSDEFDRQLPAGKGKAVVALADIVAVAALITLQSLWPLRAGLARAEPGHQRRTGIPGQLTSLVIHPTRMFAKPDVDGFCQVHSHRRGRHTPEPR